MVDKVFGIPNCATAFDSQFILRKKKVIQWIRQLNKRVVRNDKLLQKL